METIKIIAGIAFGIGLLSILGTISFLYQDNEGHKFQGTNSVAWLFLAFSL